MRKSSTRTRLADIKFQEDSEEERKRLTIELKEIERERFVQIALGKSVHLVILALWEFVVNTSFRSICEGVAMTASSLNLFPIYRVELTVNLPKLEPYIPSATHTPSPSHSPPPSPWIQEEEQEEEKEEKSILPGK